MLWYHGTLVSDDDRHPEIEYEKIYVRLLYHIYQSEKE